MRARPSRVTRRRRAVAVDDRLRTRRALSVVASNAIRGEKDARRAMATMGVFSARRFAFAPECPSISRSSPRSTTRAGRSITSRTSPKMDRSRARATARASCARAWAHDSSSTSAPEMNDGADDDEDAPLEAVRRAFESYAVSSPMCASDARRGSRLVATHVGFHGERLRRRRRFDAGRYLIAAQRDGALAMWRKGRDDRWVAQAEAPYAGAPPIVANALEKGIRGWATRSRRRRVRRATEGVYCATLSEDGDGGGWLVLRKIGVDGETTTTTATVRYADARGLEGAGGEDFWVTTTSGTFYRWNCRLGRAVARVNVWNAMNDDDDDGECVARRAGRALLTSKSYPNDALLCFDADAGRGYELLPALSAPNARSDVTTRDHTVQRVCAIQRARAGTRRQRATL